MDDRPQTEMASESAEKLPNDYDDDSLKALLSGIQARARRLMDRHGIASGHIVAMSRQAERVIDDGAERAEFLKALVDLQEFGSEAKRRGLLPHAGHGKASSDQQPDPAQPPQRRETGLFESEQAAGDEVDEDTAREFFDRLDE